ncbi:MAG: hypothetical protein RIR17_1681 [Planctomycetota bacterium]
MGYMGAVEHHPGHLIAFGGGLGSFLLIFPCAELLLLVLVFLLPMALVKMPFGSTALRALVVLAPSNPSMPLLTRSKSQQKFQILTLRNGFLPSIEKA